MSVFQSFFPCPGSKGLGLSGKRVRPSWNTARCLKEGNSSSRYVIFPCTRKEGRCDISVPFVWVLPRRMSGWPPGAWKRFVIP